MRHYSEAAVERSMRIQEVILQALAKKIYWWQAAEIIGISDRQMRRWKRRYEHYGYDGLYDRRRGKPSPRQARCGCSGSFTSGRAAAAVIDTPAYGSLLLREFPHLVSLERNACHTSCN